MMKLKRRRTIVIAVILTLCCLYLTVKSTSLYRPTPTPTPAFDVRYKIKTELDRLSVIWSESSESTPPVLPKTYGNFNQCLISNDIQQLCLDGSVDKNISTCPLEKLSEDCVLLKTVHGYDKPTDKEELDFPLAFAIKMHKAPEQAEQLLRNIYRPHNVYCIHIDKKADDAVFRVMKSIASCFPNVFLSERINFVYETYDSVRADLRTMACALNSTVKWKYYLNLAGQEFPLRTNLEMVRILKLLNGTNDIESFPLPKQYKRRITHQWKVKDGVIFNTMSTKDPPTFTAQIRKGTQYNAFSRAFIKFIFTDHAPKPIMNYFRDTLSPDETIWATINALPGTPGGYPGIIKHTPRNEHISRAVAWETEDSYRCKGKYVREVCIFARADVPWLLQQPNFFANKFRLDIDGRAVGCLEAVVNQRTRSRKSNIDLSFYKQLPHVKFQNKQATAPRKPSTSSN